MEAPAPSGDERVAESTDVAHAADPWQPTHSELREALLISYASLALNGIAGAHPPTWSPAPSLVCAAGLNTYVIAYREPQ